MRDRTRILALGVLMTVGCSLQPVQYNNLKINFYNAVQKNLSYSIKTDLVLPELKLYSSSAFPETASQFDCLAVNVMGSGVVSNSDKNPDSFMPDLLAGKFCSYSGITSAPFAQSSLEVKVDLKVPSGKDRIIQVLGILNQGKNLCSQSSSLGQMVELTGSYEIGFELGRAQVNLFSNQTVYIENKYDHLSFEEKFKRDVGCSKSSGDNGFNKPTPTAFSFFLADSNNHRILIWVTPPTTTQQAADFALGQADFGSNSDGLFTPSATTLSRPYIARTDGTRLFVAEKNNSRVLIWNTMPTTNGQAADIVLGQPNMTSNSGNNGGVSASSLIEPYSVFSTGLQLFVADTSNNRVLIWNTMPTTNGQAADIVLGQSDMSTNNINGGYPVGSIKGSSFKSPTDVFVYDNKLFVADMLNNRILIWSTIPTANNKTADVVLGQADMNTNYFATTQNGLFNPWRVYVAQGKIFVSEYGNSRVLIWNGIPAANGGDAALVLGQPSFTASTENNGGISAKTMYQPAGMWLSLQGVFYVNDDLNNRVLGWNSIPSTNQQAADFVLGQSGMTTRDVGVSATAFD